MKYLRQKLTDLQDFFSRERYFTISRNNIGVLTIGTCINIMVKSYDNLEIN